MDNAYIIGIVRPHRYSDGDDIFNRIRRHLAIYKAYYSYTEPNAMMFLISFYRPDMEEIRVIYKNLEKYGEKLSDKYNFTLSVDVSLSTVVVCRDFRSGNI